MTASPDLDGWTITRWLIEDLSSLAEPLWLVIDDLHELGASEAMNQLERLLGSAPENLRFVLLTRRDLPLGLHRLRLDGELTEIRAADLRFTKEESRALFDPVGVQLSETALERLATRIEGWAVGLRLAALSLAGHRDPERFAAEFSGSERTVTEYLLAEVLDQQPAAVRRLLLRTSVLERVSGPLADHVTGGSGAERVLGELADQGAFVVTLDPERSWFRYHRLFADLLMLELRRTAPDELPALHVSAADWFETHGHPVEAIRHAQAAERWDWAARLLSDHWFELYLDGRQATTHALLAAFPNAMTATDAELALVFVADELTGGSLDEAQLYLTHATRESASVGADRSGRFALALACMRLWLAKARNDLAAVADAAESLLLFAESAEGVPPGFGQDLRATAMANLGIAEVWTGQFADAEHHLEQTLALTRWIGRPLLELGALAYLGLVVAFRSPSSAEDLSRQALELARAHGWTDQRYVGVAYTVLADMSLWKGQLAQAEQWLTDAETVQRADADPATGLMFHGSRAVLRLVQGRHEEALADYRTVQRLGDLLTTRCRS